MRMNLASQTVTSAAVASVALLALSASPLWAQKPTEEPTSPSNVAPCWATPEQSTYQQHHQWMGQSGQMMGPGRQGMHGWGHGSQYGRMYDPNSIETLSGEVVSVDTFTPMGGMSGGMHLRLQAGNETVDVHLGPAWYLQNQDIQIQPKDSVTVTGSRINWGGRPAMMAAQVKKGGATLTLRDGNGFPVWHGWRGNQLNR